MNKATKAAMLAGVGLLAVSMAATAKDPLLGGSTPPAAVADKDLANVKGSGPFAAYYGYYGSLAAYYSYLYGVEGNINNSAGLFGLAYNDYISARNQANLAASDYNAAAYYAFFGL
jgi:hypothetical protein